MSRSESHRKVRRTPSYEPSICKSCKFAIETQRFGCYSLTLEKYHVFAWMSFRQKTSSNLCCPVSELYVVRPATQPKLSRIQCQDSRTTVFLQTRLPSWYVKARPQSSLVRLPDIVSLPRVPLLANVDVIVSGRSNEVANVTRLPPETEQSGGVVHPEVGVEASLHVSHCTTALRTHPSAVPLACLCESLCLCACVCMCMCMCDRYVSVFFMSEQFLLRRRASKCQLYSAQLNVLFSARKAKPKRAIGASEACDVLLLDTMMLVPFKLLATACASPCATVR